MFRQAGKPRYLHRFGPKKFELWQICLGLIAKQVYRLSYRRVARFLREHFRLKMHFTTLQKAAARLPSRLWQSLLLASLNCTEIYLSAADGTGFSRNNASQYFLNRIDRINPVNRHVQALALIDIKKRKFVSGKFAARPRHEARYVPGLVKDVKPEVLLLDKGFDAEWLHEKMQQSGIFSLAPVRKNCRRGKHRKFIRDNMDWCLYWQRNIIESLFSAIKRLFGSSLYSKKFKTQSTELFCRLLAYNVGYRLLRFSTEPIG